MKTIQQILGYENLTGVINSTLGGIPADILPPAFTSLTKPTEGDTGKYTKVEGTRKTARIVQYGSPSQRRDLKGISEQAVKLLHTFEHEMHNVNVLNNLRQMESTQQQRMGMEEVSRQVSEFRQLFDNLRLAAVYSALILGKIYFDGNGNLLPSSVGATTTIDFGIPAANQTNLGGLIAATWATSTTDIPGQCKGIKRTARQKTNYPLRHAFYGENILGYILKNDLCGKIIDGNNGYQNAFGQQEIPAGFLGFQWHPIEDAYFEDDGGTIRQFCDADNIVFTPEPSRDWWEMLEGSYQVPTSLGGVSNDASAALSSFAKVYGKFSYAKITDDPPGIKHHAGDTFLPVLKVPSAVYIAHVTP